MPPSLCNPRSVRAEVSVLETIYSAAVMKPSSSMLIPKEMLS